MSTPITFENLQTLNPSHILVHGVPESRTITRDAANTISVATADQVHKLAFSPSSQQLATGGKAIKIWDVATGDQSVALPAYADRLVQLHFNAEDRLLTVWAGRVASWVLTPEPTLQSEFILDQRQMQAAAWTAAGELLAAHTAADGTDLHLTNITTKTVIAEFALPQPVTAVMFSPDGQQLFALTPLGFMRLWHAADGILSAEVVIKFADEVLYLGSSADGQQVATRTRNGNTVQVWDIATGQASSPPLRIILAHSVTFSPDNQLIAVTSTRQNAGIELRAVQAGALRHTIPGGYPAIFSPDGNVLATGTAAAGQSRAVQLFVAGKAIQSQVRALRSKPITLEYAADVDNLAILKGHSLPVTCVALSPDGRWVASGSLDKTVRVWRARTGAVVATLRDHQAPVNAVVFTADGKHLISSSGDPNTNLDNTVRTYHLTEVGDELEVAAQLVFAGHTKCVTSVDVSPDGTVVASTDTDGRLLLWNLESGEIAHEIHHAAPVNDVDFSPDGRLVAAAVGGETSRGHWDSDNSVRLWDVASGQLYAVLKRHRDWVMHAKFSADGRIAAAIDYRKRLYGWDINDQQIVLDQPGATAIALTGGDDVAAVAHTDANHIQLLNPQTGTVQNELAGHTDRINQVAFSADNTLLASAAHDGTVRLWGIPLPGQTLIDVGEQVAEPTRALDRLEIPSTFTLRLIRLQCFSGQERDGDEVYLKIADRTVWDVQQFGYTMSDTFLRDKVCTEFNFRECTYNTPKGWEATPNYRPDNFILAGYTEPVTVQLWEEDGFLRGGDDLLGEVIVQPTQARFDEVECDFDQGGAFYRLTFAVLAEQ